MDPSLKNWGLAYGMYCPDTRQISIKTLQLTRTEPSKNKKLRVNSDDLLRAKLLSQAAFAAMLQADAVFVEVPHGSQSARAMVSYGACIGILASLRANALPFFELTALQVKLATAGTKTASKATIIERAMGLYPHLDWPMKTFKGETSYIEDQCSHLADAIGAIEAGVTLDEFQQLLALRQTL